MGWGGTESFDGTARSTVGGSAADGRTSEHGKRALGMFTISDLIHTAASGEMSAEERETSLDDMMRVALATAVTVG